MNSTKAFSDQLRQLADGIDSGIFAFQGMAVFRDGKEIAKDTAFSMHEDVGNYQMTISWGR